MDKDEFLDSIVGLMNYDGGAIDAGIYDPALKRELEGWMGENVDQAEQWLREYLIKMLVEKDCELEYIKDLFDWLADELHYYIG